MKLTTTHVASYLELSEDSSGRQLAISGLLGRAGEDVGQMKCWVVADSGGNALGKLNE